MPLLRPEDTTFGNGDPQPRTAWERLSQTFLRPPPPKAPVETPDFSRMDDDQKRARISTIDPTERKIGIGASILGVALAIYASVPYMVSKISVVTTVAPKHNHCAATPGITDLHYVASTKTCDGIYSSSHYILSLVLPLILAAAIYVTVRIRRRAPLAFTLVMTGLAFGSLLILVPYGGAGAWVMFRAWRTQKYGAPNAKFPLDGWTPPAPRASTRRPKSSGPSGTSGSSRSSRRSKGAQSAADVRKPPAANKRYTPKTPPPPPKKKVRPT
jgi:hypothetical protein